MQFKPEMIAAIEAGTKTQTRRPVKIGDCLHSRHMSSPGEVVGEVIDLRGRLRFAERKRYSVCPGRGKCGVALIHLTEIRCERLGDISEGDARREGYEDRKAFLAAWRSLYPRQADPEEKPVWVLTFDRR